MGGMALQIPIGSWFHDDATGAAVIESELGEQIWSEWHRTKAAAKELDALSTQIKAIIGDGSSLTLIDGRGLAVVTKSTRYGINKSALAEALGMDVADLELVWKKSRSPSDVYTLHVADRI